MSDMANLLLSIDGFLEEKDTRIDGIEYPCRPIYIEYLNLYTEKFELASNIICSNFEELSPKALFAIEAAILPLASSVANKLKIPMSVIRKPSYVGHEKDEPTLFSDDLPVNWSDRVVLLDDAIWTGHSVSHAIHQIRKIGFQKIIPFFIVDFLDFPGGGTRLSQDAQIYISQRVCMIDYGDLLLKAAEKKIISQVALERSLQLQVAYQAG